MYNSRVLAIGVYNTTKECGVTGFSQFVYCVNGWRGEIYYIFIINMIYLWC